jgi:CysZ protein
VNYFKQFFLGIRNYAKAFRFIMEHNLYWYFLIPAGLMLLIYKAGDMIQSRHFDYPLVSMNDVVWYSIRLLVEISIAVLLMKFAKYLVVVLLSPLLSHISTKCEKILTGNAYSFSIKQLAQDVKRSLRIVVRNLMWEYFFFIILFLVSFFGWEDPESSPVFYLTFVIGFYYYGFSFLDYINERRKLDVDRSIIFIRKHRGLAIAIGGVYSMLILLPVDLSILFSFASNDQQTTFDLGTFFLQLLLWLLASIAPVLAIVSATLSMHKLVDLTDNMSKMPEQE